MQRPQFRSPPPRRHAFTLTEMMIVVLIIGMVLGLVAPALLDRLEVANQRTAKSQIKLIGQMLDNYYLDLHEYPSKIDDLVRDPGKPKWKGPYVQGGVLPKDPWDNDYQYQSPGRDGRPYEVWSYGKDKAPGGEKFDRDIYTDTDL